jgi:hypothetical protein
LNPHCTAEPRAASLSDKISEVIMTPFASKCSAVGLNGFVFTSFQKKKELRIAKKYKEDRKSVFCDGMSKPTSAGLVISDRLVREGAESANEEGGVELKEDIQSGKSAGSFIMSFTVTVPRA